MLQRIQRVIGGETTRSWTSTHVYDLFEALEELLANIPHAIFDHNLCFSLL